MGAEQKLQCSTYTTALRRGVIKQLQYPDLFTEVFKGKKVSIEDKCFLVVFLIYVTLALSLLSVFGLFGESHQNRRLMEGYAIQIAQVYPLSNAKVVTREEYRQSDKNSFLQINIADDKNIEASKFENVKSDETNSQATDSKVTDSKVTDTKANELDDFAFSEHVPVSLADYDSTKQILLLVPVSFLQKLLPPSSGFSYFNWVSTIILIVAAAVVTRMALRSMVFAPLNHLNQVLFERKMFAATGGKVVDKYGETFKETTSVFSSLFTWLKSILGSAKMRLKEMHQENLSVPSVNSSSSNPVRGNAILTSGLKMGKNLRILRIPEVPVVDLGRFVNDELGHVASTLKDHFFRLEKAEKYLFDTMEALQVPLLVASRDLNVFYANRKLLELTDWELSGYLKSSKTLENFAMDKLGFTKEISNRIQLMLEGKAPRFSLYDAILDLSTQLSNVNISVSCILNPSLGALQKLAFFSFDFQHASHHQKVTLNDTIYESAAHQLENTLSLLYESRLGNHDLSPTAILHGQRIIEQINSLFDLTSYATKGQYLQNIEFNVHAFLSTFKEQTGHLQIEFSADRGVPKFIKGDPGLLRHCLRFVCDLLHKIVHCESVLISVKQEPKNVIEIAFETQKSLSTKSLMQTEESKNIGLSMVQNHKIVQEVIPLLNSFLPFYPLHLQCHLTSENETKVKLNFPFLSADGEFFLQLSSPSLDHNALNIWFFSTSTRLSEDAAKIYSSIKAKSKKVLPLTLKWTPGMFIEDPKPQVCILYMSGVNWHLDPNLNQTLKQLKVVDIPAILLTAHPKRGDARHATLLGFRGYLSAPQTQEDLANLIELTIKKSTREQHQNRIILTKHSLREYFQNVGKVLIVQFETCNEVAPSAFIYKHLSKVGFKCEMCGTQNGFIEELTSKDYDFVFLPVDFPSGLKRRMQLALKTSKLILFENGEDSQKILASGQLKGLRFVYLQANANALSIMGSLQKAIMQDDLFDEDIEESDMEKGTTELAAVTKILHYSTKSSEIRAEEQNRESKEDFVDENIDIQKNAS